MEKGARKCWLQIVPDRTRTTLMPIITKHITTGTMIHSGGWVAYFILEDKGYRHRTVNHLNDFVAEDGTSTNLIKGSLGQRHRHDRFG